MHNGWSNNQNVARTEGLWVKRNAAFGVDSAETIFRLVFLEYFRSSNLMKGRYSLITNASLSGYITFMTSRKFQRWIDFPKPKYQDTVCLCMATNAYRPPLVLLVMNLTFLFLLLFEWRCSVCSSWMDEKSDEHPNPFRCLKILLLQWFF
jgi:hypothetical protein